MKILFNFVRFEDPGFGFSFPLSSEFVRVACKASDLWFCSSLSPDWKTSLQRYVKLVLVFHAFFREKRVTSGRKGSVCRVMYGAEWFIHWPEGECVLIGVCDLFPLFFCFRFYFHVPCSFLCFLFGLPELHTYVLCRVRAFFTLVTPGRMKRSKIETYVPHVNVFRWCGCRAVHAVFLCSISVESWTRVKASDVTWETRCVCVSGKK